MYGMNFKIKCLDLSNQKGLVRCGLCCAWERRELLEIAKGKEPFGRMKPNLEGNIKICS
jgi:hypothetical protein